MHGQLWLYRTKPRPDEVFSSWLVRLAWGNAVKLQSFCRQVLRQPVNFLIGDIDRGPPDEVMRILAEGTAAKPDLVDKTTLYEYEGILWTERKRGPVAWILPTVAYGRRRKGFGQQFCRLCLLADDVPYFRRQWRLALSVACSVHLVYLEDSCPHCSAPVEFQANDFGKRLLDLNCPITQCSSCGVDFREIGEHSDRVAPADLVVFQGKLDRLAIEGYALDLPGASVASPLFLEGLHIIVHMLVSNSRGARLRNLLLTDEGSLQLGVFGGEQGQRFEGLRIGDRALVLRMSSKLFVDWQSLRVAMWISTSADPTPNSQSLQMWPVVSIRTGSFGKSEIVALEMSSTTVAWGSSTTKRGSTLVSFLGSVEIRVGQRA